MNKTGALSKSKGGQLYYNKELQHELLTLQSASPLPDCSVGNTGTRDKHDQQGAPRHHRLMVQRASGHDPRGNRRSASSHTLPCHKLQQYRPTQLPLPSYSTRTTAASTNAANRDFAVCCCHVTDAGRRLTTFWAGTHAPSATATVAFVSAGIITSIIRLTAIAKLVTNILAPNCPWLFIQPFP